MARMTQTEIISTLGGLVRLQKIRRKGYVRCSRIARD